MEEITRITTEYVAAEDRIRLSGETPAGSTVVLWLPQRLLKRLIPLLCERIEPHPAAGPREEALNSFAQMAAVQNLAPLPPVSVSRESGAYTIRAVTVATGPQVIQLVLKEHEEVRAQEFSVSLRHSELRQWLAILHRQWVRAEWEERIWPHWVIEAHSLGQAPASLSH